MVTLETEDSGGCREVAVVEGFKQELMYGLSAKKGGCFVEVQLHSVFKCPLLQNGELFRTKTLFK